MRKRRCYLAGPMRSKPKFNHPAFNDAARRLRDAGWRVYNPAEMDIEHDGKEYWEKNLQMSIAEQKGWARDSVNARRLATRDTYTLLVRLRAENGDAIVMLPDWEESIGATAERAVARWVGLRILTLKTALGEKSGAEGPGNKS